MTRLAAALPETLFSELVELNPGRRALPPPQSIQPWWSGALNFWLRTQGRRASVATCVSIQDDESIVFLASNKAGYTAVRTQEGVDDAGVADSLLRRWQVSQWEDEEAPALPALAMRLNVEDPSFAVRKTYFPFLAPLELAK